MTTLTKSQDEILRAASAAGLGGIPTRTKAAKAVVAMTEMGWLTFEEIPHRIVETAAA